MAAALLVDSVQSAAPDTIEIFYTEPLTGSGARITAFTASNNTVSSKSYKAYIYDVGGTAKEAVIPQKIVVPDRFDLGASIVGQLIPPGGTLRIESSAAASLSFRVTGDRT